MCASFDNVAILPPTPYGICMYYVCGSHVPVCAQRSEKNIRYLLALFHIPLKQSLSLTPELFGRLTAQ